MQITIVGSGPAGMVAALLLARQGHAISLVDREPGPGSAPSWDKRSVFQFLLPHGFRHPIAATLSERLPDVFDELLATDPVMSAPPGVPVQRAMLGLRREVFDRVLWRTVDREPAVTRVMGQVERLELAGDRVCGVVMNGQLARADLVVDASGRGWVSTRLRGVPEGGDCDFGYICRRYRLRPGAEPGPTTFPTVYARHCLGYQTLVFREDAGHFSALVVRERSDRELARLAEESLWDAVGTTLPGIEAWIDPERSEPVGPVRAGTGITNTYLGQARGLARLLAIGDAVCITNPMGARGVTLAVTSAVALADIVASRPAADWADGLDRWCRANMRPWFDDQVEMDAALLRRWHGEPIDPSRRLPVDLLAAIGDADPSLAPSLAPYHLMAATSASLEPLRARGQEIYASGWRPAELPGPSHADLVAAIFDSSTKESEVRRSRRGRSEPASNRRYARSERAA
jgi:2-polyprenyl-6-methoxyphenol hydroxylase-like FAD-dependent oxidoreductase